MRELRALEARPVEVFERYGYGQVATPTIEYDEVLRARRRARRAGAYRFFDERGDLLALRSDMTIPIARLVADPLRRRRAAAPLLLRRQRLPRGEPPARPDARVHAGRSRADRRRGSRGNRRGGRGAVRRARRRRAQPRHDRPRRRRPLPPAARRARRRGRAARADPRRLAAHDLVGLEDEVDRSRARRPSGRETLLALPGLRGGAEVLEHAHELGGEAVERATSACRRPTRRSRERGVADRVHLDLGLLRDLGYYTGAILEVYDPALGHILGGGGRYDDLIGRFGRDLPAAGFALYLERLHLAQAEEERIAEEERRWPATVEGPTGPARAAR